MNYETFLESKHAKQSAASIPVVDLGEHLFPYQRRIVEWALAKGRAAIFADCGLGKTLMQLTWAKQCKASASTGAAGSCSPNSRRS